MSDKGCTKACITDYYIRNDKPFFIIKYTDNIEISSNYYTMFHNN